MRGIAKFCAAAILAAVCAGQLDKPACAAGLALPERSTERSSVETGRAAKPTRPAAHSSSGWMTTTGALVIVVGLILAGAKWLRHRGLAGPAPLPIDAVQVLGRKVVDYRHTIHLVRCGSRVLVLGASQTGLTTLAEITDPVEVDYLAGLCQGTSGPTASENFGAHPFAWGAHRETERPSPETDPAILSLASRLSLSPSAADPGRESSATREVVG